MAKKIICNLPNREGNPDEQCTGVIAHMISPRMVQIGRQGKQRFSIVGSNWSCLATCPVCKREHSLVCTNGTLDESTLHLEDIADTPPEGDPTDPNDPNNPANKDPKHVAPDVPAVPEPAPNPAPAS